MIRLAIRVRREQAELVLAELLELAPAGVEELDGGDDVVEYAVYGAPGELPALPDVRALAAGALVEITTSEISDDWHDRWRDFHRPVLIRAPRFAAERDRGAPSVGGLRIRPPWEPARSGEDGDRTGERGGGAGGEEPVHEIVIDPGQAFGTGGHASTRLCLALLLELVGAEAAAGPLLDVGTGSGVLAIAAAGLGYRPVLGLDNEQESVEAAGENALANGVEIEVRRFDLREQPLPWSERSPVMLANLLRPLLLGLAAKLAVAPPHLIAGGLLAEEVDEVAAAFSRLGLRERERRREGEWAAVWMSA